jgi:hypothetical protein
VRYRKLEIVLKKQPVTLNQKEKRPQIDANENENFIILITLFYLKSSLCQEIYPIQ